MMIILIPKVCLEAMDNSLNQDYIDKYGKHFNRQLCEWAVSKMMKNGKPLEMLTKEAVDKMLSSNNITLSKNNGWDYVFVANMGKADYLGSSIPDEKHLALYIKDTIDDEDAKSGTTFCRWVATMKSNNICICWDKFI